ncbi:MAG: PorV/PorQ family protein [Candidatus Hydrogenedentota bacterium]
MSSCLCGYPGLPALALGNEDAGTTGAAFLKVGVSPRLAALGEAYGALGDDAGVIFSNPAGLGYIRRKEAQFVHANLVADIRLNSLFYAQPLPDPLGNIAVNYTLVDFGKIDRTILNAPGAANPFSTSGTFTAQDQALSIAYADEFYLWNKMFQWGMTVKLIQQSIGSEEASGLAYDAGIIYAPVQRNWRVGAAVQNLGFLSKFRDEADPLPINFKLSGAAFLMDQKLRLGMDLNLPIDNTPILNSGVEFYPIPQVALRGGYRFDNNTTDFRGPTAGIGVTLAGITMDYAYVPFELLGSNHRFSLTARFGEPVSKPTKQKEHLVSYTPPTPPQARRAASTVPPPSYAAPVAPVEARSGTTPSAARAASTASRPGYDAGSGVSVAVTYAGSTAPTYLPSPSAVHAAAPLPSALAATELVKGVRIGAFQFLGGDPKFAWIGPATPSVFMKDWKKRGIYQPNGRFTVDGSYEVIGGQLKMTAMLKMSDRTLGTFEAAGDPTMPFAAWTELLTAVNARLASLGLR